MKTTNAAPVARSYMPQVLVSGHWSENSLRFATEGEALHSASALYHRWLVCDAYRAAPADDAPNAIFNGAEVRL